MPSSNANLVPTAVTDKNGVQGIRWKRPESTPSKTAKIPTVKDAAAPMCWGVLRKDFRPVSKALLYVSARVIKSNYRRENMVSQLTPATLDVLNKRFGSDANIIGPFLDDCVRAESLAPLNNAAALIECADDPVFQGDLENQLNFFRCIAGLRRYEGFEDVDYSILGEDEREQGRALVISTEILDSQYRVARSWTNKDGRFIKSGLLADLIRRRPQDYLQIAAILKDRGLRVDTPESIEDIEALLDAISVASLSDGAL